MIDKQYDKVSGTFCGPDPVVLAAKILELVSYSQRRPIKITRRFMKVEVIDAWRSMLLERDVDQLSVWWGEREQVSRSGEVVGVDLPSVPFDPLEILDNLSELPFTLAVMPPLTGHQWNPGDEDVYFVPKIGSSHSGLGWGAILKGAGHDRFMSSRRWIDHGPWRAFCGPEDTTFIPA